MVKNTVLFVDDEIHILSSIRRAIVDEDFKALFASSGDEALRICEQHDISVIVTDMRMPGMDGLALLKILRVKYPSIVRIVLSGYTQLSQVLATVNQGDIFQFIPKPWNMEEELLATIRRGIEHHNLAAERDKLRDGLERKNKAYQNIFHAMEQKMANEKKVLTNLKHINHWTFSFWKKQLEVGCSHSQDKAAAIGYVELIEELQYIYFDILPTVVENKTLESIISEVTKACEGRMLIQSTGNGKMTFLGHHGFLIMVCKALVYLFAANSMEKALCIISANSENSDTSILDFNIGLQPIKLTASEQIRIKIGCSFLSAMGEVYDIKVLPEVIGGEVVAVQVSWSACGR